MRGLELAEPTLDELQHLADMLGREVAGSSVAIFVSSGRRFPVVAAGFKVEENKKQIFDNGLEA
jgi:hypothetical protein